MISRAVHGCSAVLCCIMLFMAVSAHAADEVPGCSTVASLPGFWKYKPTNVHGGRGPSLIIGCQNRRSWPAGRSLTILNAKGKRIGAFGLYDAGHYPYGRRYYTGVPGGSYSSATALLSGAKGGGSSNIFIKINAKVCVKVITPTGTEGFASPISSKVGAC